MPDMRRFLIVDDAAARIDEYIAFNNTCGRSQGIQLVPVASPRKAMAALGKYPNAFDGGVIADFALGGHRDDSLGERVRSPVVDENSDVEYEISTGLGILDWVHSHNRDTPLWALTEGDAAHAPLYMSAANLWLGALPLQARRFSDAPAVQRILAEELSAPTAASRTNPLYSAIVDEAAPSFDLLMNTRHKDVETIEWLHALATLPRPTRRHGFEEIVQVRIGELAGRDDIRIYFHRGFAECLTHWQYQLQQIYDQFPELTRKIPWPKIDAAAKNLAAWNEFNPFADFLGAQPECVEFLHADDVRVALKRWRDRGETW